MSALFKTVKAFVGSDESIHPTLADWKTNEIRIALSTARIEDVPAIIVQNSEAILAILRQRERKPRTPSVKPTKAKRKPKVPVAEATVVA